MTELKLPKGVKRITFIQAPVPSAEKPPTDLFAKSEKQKKKMSRGLRGLEKWTRRWALAMREMSQTYVEGHDRSNAKKRDGWLRDAMTNLAKADRDALRKLRIPVIKL